MSGVSIDSSMIAICYKTCGASYLAFFDMVGNLHLVMNFSTTLKVPRTNQGLSSVSSVSSVSSINTYVG
jgi:hypothetical protein